MGSGFAETRLEAVAVSDCAEACLDGAAELGLVAEARFEGAADFRSAAEARLEAFAVSDWAEARPDGVAGSGLAEALLEAVAVSHSAET